MGGAVSNNNFFNFNLNLNLGVPSYIQSSPAHCAGALDLLNRFFGQDMMQRGAGQFQRSTPQCGCLPSPNIQQSGAPAGQGLQQNPDGSVTTAGGYRIEANGGAEWKIFGPDGDQLTRVWGDPHVDEADGTKWDFTKSSDFVLPDGTRIFAKTNYDPAQKNGQSVTTGLEITNGADRVSIDGVNSGKPTATASHDAYEWRAAHLATDPNRDSFYLGGSGKDNVQWVRQRNGQIDGVVGEGRGHKVSAGDHQIYDQNIDKDAQICLDPSMRPPMGSRAWGNMVRSQINDAQAQMWGQLMGPAGAWPALQTAFGIHGDHIQGQFQADLQEMLFGGLPGCFPNFNSPMNALSGLIDLLRADGDWRRQLRSSQTAAHIC